MEYRGIVYGKAALCFTAEGETWDRFSGCPSDCSRDGDDRPLGTGALGVLFRGLFRSWGSAALSRVSDDAGVHSLSTHQLDLLVISRSWGPRRALRSTARTGEQVVS